VVLAEGFGISFVRKLFHRLSISIRRQQLQGVDNHKTSCVSVRDLDNRFRLCGKIGNADGAKMLAVG